MLVALAIIALQVKPPRRHRPNAEGFGETGDINEGDEVKHTTMAGLGCGWTAINRAVQSDGMLGRVQQVGDRAHDLARGERR